MLLRKPDPRAAHGTPDSTPHGPVPGSTRKDGMRAHRATKAFASPWLWLISAAFVIWIDYISGPKIQFPIADVLPVLLAAWFRGLSWALPIAIVLSAARFFFPSPEFWYESWGFELLNFGIRLALLGGFAWLVRRAATLTGQVDDLRHLLPICAWCKRIRDDSGSWTQMETYLAQRTETRFSHGICQDCQSKFLQE